MDDRSTRAHALELASRHGLPPDMTLKAARSYLAFITNKEETWTATALSNWVAASVGNATAAKAQKGGGKGAVVMTKKPAPKRKPA